MDEHTHDQPFDPAATYAPCCHPRNAPLNTVARTTWDAYAAAAAARAEAEAEARRLESDRLNQEQAARFAAAIAEMNNAN
jgi:hypothetical protein